MRWNLQEVISRADTLYGAREQAENVRACVALLEATEAYADYETAWRLGRALFFLGQEAAAAEQQQQRKEEARLLHARGARACKQAVRREPSRVEGHFWLGVNLALEAQASTSLIVALVLALRARCSLERAARINPAYHGAGPLRVLARLKHKLPRFAGGGMIRARACFERAIEIAPANTVTRLYFAEMLLEAGDQRGAQSELETILNTPLDAAWAFETVRDCRIAREMLQRMKSSARQE